MPIVSAALTINDLPPPPAGKTGWPWTESTPPLGDRRPDGSEWPRISIVTPSYNQGQFLEETIRSVLLQGYPNLEYIIIDGSSTDQSVEIIKKYEPWLTYWVSESDQGQAHAINKGFKKATGAIAAFLNSDDCYTSGTLRTIAEHFICNSQCSFICGQTQFVDFDSQNRKGFSELFEVEINDFTMTETCHIAQPSTFFRSTVFQKIGYFSESLNYCFDYDFWLRGYLSGLNFESYNQVFSKFRLHELSKTNNAYAKGKFDKDFIEIYLTALSKNYVKAAQKKRLRHGLGIAASLWFVHLESSISTEEAKKSLWNIVKRKPDLLLAKSIWRTFLVSLSPVWLRQNWQKIKLS